jgi:hypothetical protein
MSTAEKTASLAIVPEQSSQPAALLPRNFEDAMKIAETFAKSEIVPKAFRGKPADVFVAMELGAELGFPPMASLRHIFVLPNGTTGIGAQALHGVCMVQRDCEYFRRNDSESEHGKVEVWECKRRGVTHTGRYSMEDAKRANLLGKDNWKHYAADMLENRAIARCARRAYPDRVGGLHTPDEVDTITLEETAPGSNSFAPPPLPAASPKEPSVPGVTLELKIDAATTEAELDTLTAECKEIKSADAARGDVLLKQWLTKRNEIRSGASE